MKSIKQNLQAVSRELKALSKKTESLMKEINKLEKSQPAKNPKKASVKKKIKGLTETDKVLNIIKISKKGVAVAALKKKTGFNDKKISNIVFRAFKAGKIKRADKGVYMAA